MNAPTIQNTLSDPVNVDDLPISVKASIFRTLNAQLPISQYGLPDYIYRADLIPSNLYDIPPQQRQSMIGAATLGISFEHGFPAVSVSPESHMLSPMWEQLPGESVDAFNAFMVYLELPEKSNHENPVRLLPMIAAVLKAPIEQIVSYSIIYYWFYRSRAYDLFLIACHRKQREQRLMSIEGSHFKLAEELLAKIQKITHAKLDEAIGNLSDADADTSDLKIKDLVDNIDKLTKIQRVAVGLPAAGPTQVASGSQYAPLADSFQEIVQASQAGSSKPKSLRTSEMDRILSNPDDLAQVQDLVIRIGLSGGARTNMTPVHMDIDEEAFRHSEELPLDE